MQDFRLDGGAREDLRPRLVADPQRIAITFDDEQERALALALEQRIGGGRGAHLDRPDASQRDSFPPARGR
jgi:hypothetical protein